MTITTSGSPPTGLLDSYLYAWPLYPREGRHFIHGASFSGVGGPSLFLIARLQGRIDEETNTADSEGADCGRLSTGQHTRCS